MFSRGKERPSYSYSSRVSKTLSTREAPYQSLHSSTQYQVGLSPSRSYFEATLRKFRLNCDARVSGLQESSSTSWTGFRHRSENLSMRLYFELSDDLLIFSLLQRFWKNDWKRLDRSRRVWSFTRVFRKL